MSGKPQFDEVAVIAAAIEVFWRSGYAAAAVSDLIDWILRILLSYAALPGPAELSPADIRRQLRAWFRPAFDRFL